MVFYAAFNSISVISQRQLTLFMISWVSPVLGRALKCLAQGHSHEKTQRIQCGSNPGPLDYESNTLPLGHAGPYIKCRLEVHDSREVLRCSVVLYLTCNPEILGSNRTGSPGFFSWEHPWARHFRAPIAEKNYCETQERHE